MASVIYPVDISSRISSLFGKRAAPIAGASTNHAGIDFAVPEGTKVNAATGGIVERVGYSSARGNYVYINNGNGLQTVYQHLLKPFVEVGDNVVQGQNIALSGKTGISTGAHLHFETIINGKNVDPLSVLTKTNEPQFKADQAAAAAAFTNKDAKTAVNSAVGFLETNWAIVCGVLVALGLLDRIQK